MAKATKEEQSYWFAINLQQLSTCQYGTCSSLSNILEMETRPTPLPMKKVLILCTILVTEGVLSLVLMHLSMLAAFCLTMLFPYLPFMVRDFHLTDDESEIGFYSGFIASSFCLAQFISRYVYNYYMDSSVTL